MLTSGRAVRRAAAVTAGASGGVRSSAKLFWWVVCGPGSGRCNGDRRARRRSRGDEPLRRDTSDET